MFGAGASTLGGLALCNRPYFLFPSEACEAANIVECEVKV